MINLDSYKPEFDKAIEHLKNEIAALRTGRATPALVEDILVEAYGVKTPLKGLASVSLSDPKTLLIEPWDKGVLKEIEKSIQLANIGINPVNEGARLRLSVPPLTEESRRELIKILQQKLEQSRISLRSIRDKIRSEIIEAEREKQLTEDDRYRSQEKLDELIEEYHFRIKEIGEQKEKEIMTI
jgi:ribosome recycling factor